MKVAVVIPCHNVAALVARAIGSALDQGIPGLEVIAVDDASGDGTVEALHACASGTGGSFRVIAMETRAGACAARNAGMAATDAQWVQFLDADDALLPGKIARQLAIAQDPGGQHARIDVVAGAFINRYETARADEEVQPLAGDPWEALVRTRLGTTSANLFRRQALIDAGGWDEHLRSSQDYDLLFRMMKRGARIAVDETPSAIVLKRERGSISRTDEQANWLRYIELRRAIRDHLKALDPMGHAAIIATADQYLFMAIRVLSAHDRTAAFAAFDRIIPEGFIPEPSHATRSMYISLYKLLGFRWAERLAGVKDAMMGR